MRWIKIMIMLMYMMHYIIIKLIYEKEVTLVNIVDIVDIELLIHMMVYFQISNLALDNITLTSILHIFYDFYNIKINNRNLETDFIIDNINILLMLF